MNYEEKLRLAKEALDSGSYDKETIEYIFPELKESNDERIRKEILEYFKQFDKEYNVELRGAKISDWIAWLEKQVEQKPTDKVEPKFRVKYAGNEYNVFEVKDIGGVTYYGIEDEPNHIDYVLPENCEIVSDYGYGVKEKGSPYPTKSAIFSKHNPAWSEEDESKFKFLYHLLEQNLELHGSYSFSDVKELGYVTKQEALDMLKSLKERMKGENE